MENWTQLYEETVKPRHKVNQDVQSKKLTLKDLTNEGKTQFGDHLHPNKSKMDVLLGFISIHILPEFLKGEKILTLQILCCRNGLAI